MKKRYRNSRVKNDTKWIAAKIRWNLRRERDLPFFDATTAVPAEPFSLSILELLFSFCYSYTIRVSRRLCTFSFCLPRDKCLSMRIFRRTTRTRTNTVFYGIICRLPGRCASTFFSSSLEYTQYLADQNVSHMNELTTLHANDLFQFQFARVRTIWNGRIWIWRMFGVLFRGRNYFQRTQSKRHRSFDSLRLVVFLSAMAAKFEALKWVRSLDVCKIETMCRGVSSSVEQEYVPNWFVLFKNLTILNLQWPTASWILKCVQIVHSKCLFAYHFYFLSSIPQAHPALGQNEDCRSIELSLFFGNELRVFSLSRTSFNRPCRRASKLFKRIKSLLAALECLSTVLFFNSLCWTLFICSPHFDDGCVRVWCAWSMTGQKISHLQR